MEPPSAQAILQMLTAFTCGQGCRALIPLLDALLRSNVPGTVDMTKTFVRSLALDFTALHVALFSSTEPDEEGMTFADTYQTLRTSICQKHKCGDC